MDLLHNAPTELTKPVREGGGVTDWIYKGTQGKGIASIDAVIDYSGHLRDGIRYFLAFSAVNQRFEIHDECRKGFRFFLEKAGLEGKMPRIVACGGRRQAYEMFCTKVDEAKRYKDCIPVLLVDSEKKIDTRFEGRDIANWKPWDFLKEAEGEKWNRPTGADNNQCHFMVQCMESWLLCDPENLQSFFGQGFLANKLPPENVEIEGIVKEKVYAYMADTTKRSEKKGNYKKGLHSFKLLETTDYQKVIGRSKWAKRFLNELQEIMQKESV